MKVLKFGGTSVGSAQRMKKVYEIVRQEKQAIVVLSAMSGTTNSLVEITKYLYEKKRSQAIEMINGLNLKYVETVKELLNDKTVLEKGMDLVNAHFNYLMSFTQDSFTIHEEKAILAQGELLSTALFQLLLEERGEEAVLLPALGFMRIDKDMEPDAFYIKENLNRLLEENSGRKLYITQGFICRNNYGEIDNLKRGGSDYTASLIGVAVQAEEVQIWTDIDGMHNNDPRYVDSTQPIEHLSFAEAAELAYFGAKILHPSSVLPAQRANVPVRLKSTLAPEAKGTLITQATSGDGIKAIAAKDKITAIKINSGRMLLAHGFLRRVFEIFELYKTSIDMITTSEVAVSVTIDNNQYLEEITEELRKYGKVEVDKEQSIICVVGDFIQGNKGVASQIFNTLKEVPIRMISYGGSNHNISLLVNTSDKVAALKNLNTLFE